MTTQLPYGPDNPVSPAYPPAQPYEQGSGRVPSSLTASGFAPSGAAPSGLPEPAGQPRHRPPAATPPDGMPSGLAGVPIAGSGSPVPARAQPTPAGPAPETPQPAYPAQPYPGSQDYAVPPAYLVSGMYPMASTREAAPALWPVAVFTLLFGIFGGFSARRRARKAQDAGHSGGPYYLTFGVVVLFSVLTGFVWVVPAFLAARENAVTKSVQSNIVTDGTLTASTGLAATKAACTPSAERGDDGQRPYVCEVSVSDGRHGTLNVRADSDGHWTLAPIA
jgi:hypothetical protein